MRETTVEANLLRQVSKAGGVALKFISPGNRGMPDRLILLPDGRHVFVELKKPGKKPRVLQAWWHEKMRALGHQVFVIDTPADVTLFVQEVCK